MCTVTLRALSHDIETMPDEEGEWSLPNGAPVANRHENPSEAKDLSFIWAPVAATPEARHSPPSRDGKAIHAIHPARYNVSPQTLYLFHLYPGGRIPSPPSCAPCLPFLASRPWAPLLLTHGDKGPVLLGSPGLQKL
jgi:hypothetical protein